MKKVAICGVLTVLCIVATILLRKPMDNAELDYQEVKAYVVSSQTKQETVRSKYSTSTRKVYEVIVRYEGKEYKLKNAHNSYSYRAGQNATAYLYKGNLYANTEGVRNASPAGIAYNVALIASFAMFLITMLLLTKVGQKKKQNPPQE